MRNETIIVDSFVHVINRGNKQAPIYKQKSDLWRLLFSLFYSNNNLSRNWMRELEKASLKPQNFIWPDSLGERKPIVAILGFTIMPNHFHLILKEIVKGGISNFMHKFSMGHSKFINAKYKESGVLFQGTFQSKIIETDEYLRRVAVYVMVKNTFELYPKGGLAGATKNFEEAWAWAVDYPFSSLGDYAGVRSLPILDKDLLGEIFDSPKDFKEFSKDYILGRTMDEDISEFEFYKI
ncbi:MAG: transposase [Candidatus Zambryskibacteria bacterium]|nr:transposase [Candidatus Zambryskibacteria bacterium]